MGEIADAILDGTLCEGCGEVFDDVIEGREPPGHPRRCPTCGPSTRAARNRARKERAKVRKARAE